MKFIKFKKTSSSYKLWINNQLKAVNGVVAKEKEQQIPQRKEEIIALPTNTTTIELVMQISNFFFADGGFKTDWENIQLGTSNQINKQVKKQLTLDIFIFGSLFIIALYHLGHFLIARKHYFSFYFGLLCLVLALRNFSFSSAFFTLFPTDFPFWVRVKLEFFLGYSGAALFATYVYSLFTKQMETKLIRGYQLLMVVLLLIIVLAPIQIYEPTLLPFELSTLIVFCYLFFIVVREAYQKKEKSTIVLIVTVKSADKYFLYGAVWSDYFDFFSILSVNF